MFTFKYLIESQIAFHPDWLLKAKIVSHLLHASYVLLGAEGNAKGVQRGFVSL